MARHLPYRFLLTLPALMLAAAPAWMREDRHGSLPASAQAGNPPLQAAATGGDENVQVRGIWSHENTVVVFAGVYPCPPNELSAPGAAQLFVSTDGGAHWEKNGPQFEGSEFEYVHEEGTRLWIVGEHTAEGPASEAFILMPDGKGLTWTRYVIYTGDSSMESIAVSANGEFTAWIRHINIHSNSGKWTGSLYMHKSTDGGRTWQEVGRAKKVQRGPGSGFQEIERETPTWRIAEKFAYISTIEHRPDEHSEWKPVSEFRYNVCKQ